MDLKDFDYDFPKELIAQKPLPERESSRLLVVDRKDQALKDRHFREVMDYCCQGDVLVLNDTKVFRARLMGKKKKTGGKAELLLLENSCAGGNIWRCLMQPTMKEGQEIVFEGELAEAAFIGRDKDGLPLVEFRGITDAKDLFEKIGTMPLPPYIKREPDRSDEESYQTVFAKKEGAVAAPTAGLHFTPELLERIKKKGVQVVTVTLHVGYGTFKPVENLENHQMLAETFELTPTVAKMLNEAKTRKNKIIAVGTTSLRVLETCVQDKRVISGCGKTDLFIKPPFEFEVVDHLITNFHLPKTTLLLLASAFMGEALRKRAYNHAIAEKYRFYSYGDAMLII